ITFVLEHPPRARIPTNPIITATLRYCDCSVMRLICTYSFVCEGMALTDPVASPTRGSSHGEGSRCRPGRIVVELPTGRQPFQASAVGVDHIDIPPPTASGTEHDVSSVYRPRRRLVVAAPRRQLPRLLAIGADQADLEDLPLVAAHVREPIPLGRPYGGRIIAPVSVRIGQGSDVRAVRAHEIDLWRATPVRSEGELASGWRPRRGEVRGPMLGQPFEAPTGLAHLVDFRISVPGGREREFLPARGPFRSDVQARQRNERPSGAGDQIQLLNLRIIPFAIRHKRQPPPILRPRRRQVQSRTERQLPQAIAVILHHEKLLGSASFRHEDDLTAGNPLFPGA